MTASLGERRLRCGASQLQSVFVDACEPMLEMTLVPSARTTRLTCPSAAAQSRSMTAATGKRIDNDNTRMSFAPIQQEVDDYISQFKEGYFPPLAMKIGRAHV